MLDAELKESFGWQIVSIETDANFKIYWWCSWVESWREYVSIGSGMLAVTSSWQVFLIENSCWQVAFRAATFLGNMSIKKRSVRPCRLIWLLTITHDKAKDNSHSHRPRLGFPLQTTTTTTTKLTLKSLLEWRNQGALLSFYISCYIFKSFRFLFLFIHSLVLSFIHHELAQCCSSFELISLLCHWASASLVYFE